MKSISNGFIGICIMMALAGGTSFAQQVPVYHSALDAWPTAVSGRQVRILCLGTQVTAGTPSTLSYRYYLWNRLQKAGYLGKIDFVGTRRGVGENGTLPSDTAWDMDHEGNPGLTSAEFKAGLGSRLRILGNSRRPDMALVCIGTEDLAAGLTLDQSRANISATIDTLRSINSRMTILLARIPASAIAEPSLSEFNTMLAKVSIAKDLAVSPLYLADHSTGIVAGDYLADGINLNQSGDQKSADIWYPLVASILDAQIGKPLEITPRSGPLCNTQIFDMVILLRSTAQISSYTMTHNGFRVFPYPLTGTLTGAGRTFRIAGVSGKHLIGAGTSNIALTLNLGDGTSVSDAVSYEVLGNREP